MNKIDFLLNTVWKSFPNAVSDKEIPDCNYNIDSLVLSLFCVGEFYYFVLDITDGMISNCSKNILDIHPMDDVPNHISDLFKFIHPGDLDHIQKAEKITFDKFIEIGLEHKFNLKSNYNFRIKNKYNNYDLFHHQSIPIMEDEKGRVIKSLNIHTNINYITTTNNYNVLISGFSTRNDYILINTNCEENTSINTPETSKVMTKREREILMLVAKGYMSKEIAELLNISQHTVLTHRKNLLSKINVKNSTELVKVSIEMGYI